MPRVSRYLDERVWQLSAKDVAAPPAPWNKRTLPRTHEEPCEDHVITVFPSVDEFTTAVRDDLDKMRREVEEGEDAAIKRRVVVDYEIRNNVMHAEINLYGVFKYVRTPLLLRREEGNWLMTIPLLSGVDRTVELTLRAKFDETITPVVRAFTFGPQAQYEEFNIEGFNVVIVVNAADTLCREYTKKVETAGRAASHLCWIIKKLSALVNNRRTAIARGHGVSAQTVLQSLYKCDQTLCEASEWTKRWRSMTYCDAGSVILHAMKAKSAGSGEEDWSISHEDVLESVDLGSSAYLLSDARCADELVENKLGEGVLCLTEAYEHVMLLKNKYVGLRLMTKLLFPTTSGVSQFLGLRELLEQRKRVMREIYTQTRADKTSNYQKPLNRVLYLVLNCIDCCLCHTVDGLCGIESLTSDVCLHSRQLRHLGMQLPDEGLLVARGQELIAQAMLLRRDTAHVVPDFLHSGVMKQLWKTKIIELVEESMFSYTTHVANNDFDQSSNHEDYSICRIARRHNEYYAKMRQPRIILELLVMEVCTDTKWSQLFKTIVFGDMQMQVIRSQDTMRALMKVDEHKVDFFLNPEIKAYMETHLFIELLTQHMAGWDIPVELLEKHYKMYMEDKDCYT